MSTTVTLYADASAWITKANPDTNQHNINTKAVSGMVGADITTNQYLLLRFPSADPAYQYRPYSASLHTYGKATTSIGSPSWWNSIWKASAFDPNTVTFNNATRPITITGTLKFTATHTTAAWDTINNYPGGLSLNPTYIAVQPSSSDTTTLYGSASSSYKPYISIVFSDEDAYLTVAGLRPANASVVVSGMANTFSWRNDQTETTLTQIAQTSAVLKWKHNSGLTWNEIPISGNVTEYTFPADTFPPGKIEWKVEITDATGHTATSDTNYFFSTFKMLFSSAALVSKDLSSNRQYNPAEPNLIRSEKTWRLVARFPDIPSQYLNKKLLKTILRTTFGNQSAAGYNLWGLPFDVDTLTVIDSDLPTRPSNVGYGSLQIDTSGTYQTKEQAIPKYYIVSPTQSNEAIKNALASKSMLASHCLVLQAYSDAEFYVSGDIWLEIAVDDTQAITSHVTQKNCPTSGWVPPGQDNVFAWTFENYGDYPCPGDFVQASGSFFWREQGDTEWNEIAASGSTQGIVVPADTFPGGTIEWYISGTDTYGTTTTTPVYTISTEDTIPSAVPMDPVSVPTTGNKPIDFRWVVSNDSGSLPTRSDLQYSTDGETWTDLTSVIGSSTTYTAAAYAFGIGTILWRVRAYNRDGVAGGWSEAVSFLNIMAPMPPTVTVQAVPFAVISWQASNQQAYRITVDGKVYGPFFGTDKSYRLKDYLFDGEHTVSVEIQGAYSLWSDPGSATFTIANQPGDAITLTGEFDIDAELTWSTSDDDKDFYIYRDGAMIGHTYGASFVDRVVLGSHEWVVVNRLQNGNYTKSNSVTGFLVTEETAIADFSNGNDWIRLKLTERAQTQRLYGYARTHALIYVTGAVWPVLELSPFESMSATFDCAFLTAEDAQSFFTLHGRQVIVKTKDGDVIVGAFTSLSKKTGDFYLAFEFTLQRIHWEDYIDDTNR